MLKSSRKSILMMLWLDRQNPDVIIGIAIAMTTNANAGGIVIVKWVLYWQISTSCIVVAIVMIDTLIDSHIVSGVYVN